MASPAAFDPWPLVTLVRSRMVAKVDSIVILSPRGGQDRDLGCFVEDSVRDETA
jgi:hypothetical protein